MFAYMTAAARGRHTHCMGTGECQGSVRLSHCQSQRHSIVCPSPWEPSFVCVGIRNHTVATLRHPRDFANSHTCSEFCPLPYPLPDTLPVPTHTVRERGSMHGVCVCVRTGRGQAFAGAAGGPMLLPVVEDWVKGVRSNLLQWSTRLLGQEQWQPYSSGQVCAPAHKYLQHSWLREACLRRCLDDRVTCASWMAKRFGCSACSCMRLHTAL